MIDQPPINTVINLIMHIALVVSSLIILVGVFFIILGNIPEQWKEECISLGGEYYEIENVTCALGYSQCFRICSLNGQRFGYYDVVDLCAEDCKYENNKNNGLMCVC